MSYDFQVNFAHILLTLSYAHTIAYKWNKECMLYVTCMKYN
jgi:hypothetical protein